MFTNNITFKFGKRCKDIKNQTPLWVNGSREDRVFIGSNTALVAPVVVFEGATIGAGSTITQNVPANRLSISRSRQRIVDNWERPSKKTSEREEVG